MLFKSKYSNLSSYFFFAIMIDWTLGAIDFTCLSQMKSWLYHKMKIFFVACILEINMIIINICFPYVFKCVLLIPRHSFHLIAYYCYCLLHIGLSEAKTFSRILNWIAISSYKMLFDCHKIINIWKYTRILVVWFTHLLCKSSSTNKNELWRK